MGRVGAGVNVNMVDALAFGVVHEVERGQQHPEVADALGRSRARQATQISPARAQTTEPRQGQPQARRRGREYIVRLRGGRAGKVVPAGAGGGRRVEINRTSIPCERRA